MPTPQNSESMPKRDPITGSGMSDESYLDGKTQTRPKSLTRLGKNPILLAWSKNPERAENGINRKCCAQARNPIALTGDLGAEVDVLRTTPRTKMGTPRDPQRNPISGEGDFGTREWDPIWKYSGRVRRSKSSNGMRCNPLTGMNVKTYEINLEDKPERIRSAPNRNIITGDNCTSYTYSPEMKTTNKMTSSPAPRNAITGENCTTYEINSEVKTPRVAPNKPSSNPISGDNVVSYVMAHDEKLRPNKPYIGKSVLTGENLESYQITPIERKVKPKVMTIRQDPLSGENVQSYTYHIEEKTLTSTKRDFSSPLTGLGSRGQSYTISMEERSSGKTESGDPSGRARARSSGPVRNILTGENCDTYQVCQNMRSERSGFNCPSAHSTHNILLGI